MNKGAEVPQTTMEEWLNVVEESFIPYCLPAKSCLDNAPAKHLIGLIFNCTLEQMNHIPRLMFCTSGIL